MEKEEEQEGGRRGVGVITGAEIVGEVEGLGSWPGERAAAALGRLAAEGGLAFGRWGEPLTPWAAGREDGFRDGGVEIGKIVATWIEDAEASSLLGELGLAADDDPASTPQLWAAANDVRRAREARRGLVGQFAVLAVGQRIDWWPVGWTGFWLDWWVNPTAPEVRSDPLVMRVGVEALAEADRRWPGRADAFRERAGWVGVTPGNAAAIGGLLAG